LEACVMSGSGPAGREEANRMNQRWAHVAYGLFCLLIIVAVFAVALLLSDAKGPEPVSFRAVSPLTEAYRAYVSKDYARAKATIDEQLKVWPDDHELKLLQIRVLLEMGRLAEAKKVADSFQKAKVEGVEVLVALAELYRKMGYPDAAAGYLGKALQIRRDDAYLWKEMALLQYAQGRHMEALTSCQESLRLDPSQEDLKKLSGEIAMALAEAPTPAGTRPGASSVVDGLGPRMREVADPTRSIPRPQDYLPKPGGTPR
jgi:tetratricopeptide (TPR) repeat protein